MLQICRSTPSDASSHLPSGLLLLAWNDLGQIVRTLLITSFQIALLELEWSFMTTASVKQVWGEGFSPQPVQEALGCTKRPAIPVLCMKRGYSQDSFARK